jgi:hypothetical protein
MRIYFFLLFLTSREIFERIAFKPEYYVLTINSQSETNYCFEKSGNIS